MRTRTTLSGLIAILSLAIGSQLSAASLKEESRLVDAFLETAWKAQNVVPNPPASDEVILRRLYLDLIGRIPTHREACAFLDSADPEKRAKLIDHLLASEGYASHQFNLWADLLRVNDAARGAITTQAYVEWIKNALRDDMPYNEFVHRLVVARGGAWDNGAIGFQMRDDNRLDHLAYLSQVFLGTQVMCAQCHDHPFDQWKQTDFYGLYAYTSGFLTSGGYLDPFASASGVSLPATGAERRLPRDDERRLREIVKEVMDPLRFGYVSWDERRLPQLPPDYAYDNAKPGDVISPRVLFGPEPTVREGEPRVEAFARWLTSPENPRFTSVIANRLWARVFGAGLVEPLDDFTARSTPSNPDLLAHLTRLMIRQGYSMKTFQRVLYNTEAYQREATGTERTPGEAASFAGPPLRRMSAEQVWDSLVTLMRGNVDGAPSPESARVNQYLADVSKLMTTLREMGPEAVLAATRDAAERVDAANVARRQMRRDPAMAAEMAASNKERVRTAVSEKLRSTQSLLATIVGAETAERITARTNLRQYQNLRARVELPEAENLSREEVRALIHLTGGGLGNALRASEMPSPTPPGHFLRIFGQSDRENISNANNEPSATQSLVQLNGPLFLSLTHPSAAWRQNLEASDGPLSSLYLALLSRAPTAREIAIHERVLRERGDAALDDMTYALLNGAEFLFIP